MATVTTPPSEITPVPAWIANWEQEKQERQRRRDTRPRGTNARRRNARFKVDPHCEDCGKELTLQREWGPTKAHFSRGRLLCPQCLRDQNVKTENERRDQIQQQEGQ